MELPIVDINSGGSCIILVPKCLYLSEVDNHGINAVVRFWLSVYSSLSFMSFSSEGPITGS